MRWLFAFALAAAVAVTLSLALGDRASPHSPSGFETPRHRGSVAADRSDPLALSSTVQLGVSLASPTPSSLNSFTALAGARPRVVMWYQQWSEPIFYPQQMAIVAARGAYPMITWDPIDNGVGIPLSQIAAGRWDAYLRTSALAAAAWRRPVYLRLAHEMNLPGSAFGPGHEGNTAAEFVAAWRRVVSIFRQEGASRVHFVWSPNVDCQGHCPFTAFVPGDRWTDWVALDGYNYAGLDDDRWLSFAQLFGPSYRIITRLSSKPLMIGETSSSDLGGSKAQWILGMGSALAHQFTRVRVLVWFQRVKETDWRISSSPQALAAFRRVVRSPLFTLSGRR